MVSVAGGEACRLSRPLEGGFVAKVDTSLLGVGTSSSGGVCPECAVIVFLRCGASRGRLSSEII